MSDARAWSFHSVKGGVGKSTLAVLCAARVAQDEDVVLIDADLTGTSLADVLPLHAPVWSGAMDPRRKPSGHGDPGQRVEERRRTNKAEPVGVPYLNDWLRHPRDVEWKDPEYDVEALLWRPADTRLPDRLRVIPSSALPADLLAVLPLLYDESFSAFAESRLEWLLDGLLKLGIRAFVFDTPPTIPGFSRAVLSMALRLPAGEPLAADGVAPARLERTAWSWRPWLVTTQDRQDLSTTEGWLSAIDADERRRIGVVLNRFTNESSSIPSVVTTTLLGLPHEEAALKGVLPTLLDPPPVVVPDADGLGLFDAWKDRFQLPDPLPSQISTLFDAAEMVE